MKYLRIFVVSVIVLLATSLLGATKAQAIPVDCNSDPNNSLSCVCSQPSAANSPTCRTVQQHTDPLKGSQGVLGRITSIVFFITGIASIIVIMLGGIQYMLSMGDSAKIAKAKDTILYAVVGLLISVFAEVIVKFVVSKF